MADSSGAPPWQAADRTSTSARLQSLRNLLNSERRDAAVQQAALNALESEILERSITEGPASERTRRDQDVRSRVQDTIPVSEGPPSTSSPSSIIRSRRRAFRPSQRLQRQRDSHEQTIRPESLESMADLRRQPQHHASIDAITAEHISENQMNRDQRYRAKRRRLNDGTCDDDSKIHTYGDQGRLTPGPLKLEVVSCDGGEHARNPTGMPQHVLQDDNLVYSTKDNRCNLLLKHVGGMPFSLSRIVFKSPKTGYDAPVHEGMLFVAMTDDQLLERTVEYESRYSPRGYRQHHYQRPHDIYRPSQEHVHTSMSVPPMPLDQTIISGRDYYSSSWSRYRERNLDLETSQRSGFDVSLSDPSDSEDGFYPGTSPPRYHDLDTDYTARSYAGRHRPRARQFQDVNWDEATESSTSDSEDDDTPLYQDNDNDDIRLMRHRMLHRARYPLDRASSGSVPAPGGSNIPPQPREWRQLQNFVRVRSTTPPPVRSTYNAAGTHDRHDTSSTQTIPSGGKTRSGHSAIRSGAPAPLQTLVPHARFHLRKTKTGVAVNFDPPIAGRYILIKLWSSCPNGNIDIRSIIATGYGGPRFFPKIELR